MDTIFREVRERGYVLLPNVLSQAACDGYKRKIINIYAKYGKKYNAGSSVTRFHGEQTKMIYNLHNKDIEFIHLIDHPVTIPIVRAMLQEGSYKNSEPFILKLSTARSPGRGEPKQQLHIDANLPGSPYCLVSQVVWLLDDFSKENGGTRIVPCSHRRTSYAEDGKDYSDEVVIEAPRGSVLVYDGGAWHASGENKFAADRWGIINTYCRWFMKPSFDFIRNTPREIYDQMTPFQRELLGFTTTPPKDEFTRLSRRSVEPENPAPYTLPL